MSCSKSSRLAVLNGFASKNGTIIVKRIIQSPYVVDEQILLMIVVPAIAIDFSASEVLLNQLKHSDASFTLNNRESGLALPSQRHLTISLYGAAEAAFPVDEADDPLLDT